MRLFLFCFILTICIPLRAVDAQGYPFSQRGSVTQTVAFTEIAVTYGRPVARGRVLFGELVPWDSVWHPGADSATGVSFDHGVLIEGQKVEAGEYSLWLVPREAGAWTFVLSRAAHVFHKPYPGSSLDALRVPIPPERLSLAIYFPRIARQGDDAISLGRDRWLGAHRGTLSPHSSMMSVS